MSFLSELKRRKVFRVAAVYAATAYVVIQAADLIFPRVALPSWTVTLVVWLAILGFPVALALAWAFDFTSRGIRPAEEAPAAAGAPSWLGKRSAAATAVLVILGLGLGAGWFLRPAASGLIGGGDEPVTLAVLPFHNLSGDPGTEPFVHGVHDDLLTHLSRFDDLRVISRTSVMEYQETDKNVREIAAELGAGAIVEGGIQRSGDRVRVNVQLIDARTDEHLWAETYDRELTAENVFAIQAEIAQSVAAALHTELAPSDVADLAGPHTSSLEALEAYHAGRRAYYEGDLEVRETVATREFERAVELDPEFAEAWAGLSYARSWLVRQGIERDTLPALEALDRARELDPDGFETRLASAFYQYYARHDFHRAYEEFLGVHRDAPQNATVLLGLPAVERRLGRWDDAIEHYQESIRLDPRNATTQLDLGATMVLIERHTEGIPHLERALRISPSREDANLELFTLLLWGTGDSASARTFVEERTALRDSRIVSKWRADLALVRRDYAAARRALEAFPEEEIDASPFTGYGTYYSQARPLLFARVAWLEGDAPAVDRYTEEALRWADASPFSRPGPDPWGYARVVHLMRALAYAYRGDVERALAEAEQVPAELDRDEVDNVNILGGLVLVWIVTGEKERALDGLERLDAASLLTFRGALRLDPMYDSLRNEPRFQRLVAN